MRIALVSPYTLPECRGNSMLAQRLANGLARRGHQVRLFNSGRDEPSDAGGFSPDVVHSLHAVRPVEWIERAFPDSTLPRVVTLTGTDYNSWSGSDDSMTGSRYAFERAHAVVVFHEEARRTLAARHAGLAAKLQVVPQGVAESVVTCTRQELRRRYMLEQEAVIFFMAAGIRAVKNIGLALDAFSLLQARVPRARLFLAGPVIDEAEARKVLAAGKHLRGFAYFGEIHHVYIRELMACADAFVSTSCCEGMPGAVMEAMAEGLPVLATDVPGNRALVADGRNGYLVSADDAGTLARAARTLAGAPALRQRMGDCSRQVAAAAFDPETELDRYEAVYEQVLSGRRRRLTSAP